MTVRFSADKPVKVKFSGGETVKAKFSEVIVSHDIPSNYGLITWDGSTLTVS